MIIKGQAFTFMYETRDKHTGMLVSDRSSTHTIRVYYKGDYGWVYSTTTGQPSGFYADDDFYSPVYIGQENSDDVGLYLCKLDNNIAKSDHIVVSITSSNTDVVIPMQQFYPVDMSQFSSSGNGASAASVAEYVWHYGESNFGGSTDGVTATRTLPSSERNAIADALLDRNASVHTASQTLGSLINNGVGGGGGTYYVDTSSLQTQVGLLTSQVSSLTTIQNNMSSLLSSNGSLYTLMDSLDAKLDDLDDLTDANTLAAAVWDYAEDHTASIACLNDIAENVWTYSGTRALTTNILDTTGNPAPALMLNSETHRSNIATAVWGSTTRKLTSRQIGTSDDYIAKSGDFAVSITNDNFSVDLPDADDIATAVWTGGYDRTLTSPNISGTNYVLATATDTAAIATAVSNIPTNVWSDQTAATRSLTTESIGSGKSLATASDTSDVSDLIDTMMTTLSKIYGVLCHWKVDGNNIIVYDDDNETLLTLPTVKNKYGDILQMGEMPEER